MVTGARDPARIPRRGLVSRTALVRRLIAAADKALVLMVAPAGYGKSELLREWSERDRRPFIWLDPHEFSVDVDDSAAGQRSSASGFVLVIDDAHLADPADLREFTGRLLARLGAASTLAIASRRDLDLPTGRLRAHRALLELGARDLAMNSAEAAVALRRAGLNLDLASVEALARRTEGWPAGLYLAALSLKEENDRASVTGFGGDDRLIVEYFRDEMLSNAPPDLLEFELRSSVLDELSGPVCDAVLGRRGSARMLARAASWNQFLSPLDHAHSRYRFHGLLKETLERELQRDEPELAVQLHSRASAWLREQGDVDGAIRHAIAADDERGAEELILANLGRFLTTGRASDVEAWLDRIGEARVTASRSLALTAGLTALAMGDAEQAKRWRLAAAAHERPGALEDPPELAVASAVLEAMTARTGVEAMLEAADRAYQTASESSPWRPVSALVRGIALHLSGERRAANELLEESGDLAASVEPSITAASLAHRAVIAAEDGDWDAVSELAEAAVAMLLDHGLGDEPVSALVFAAAALVQARGGRPDEGKQSLRKSVELLSELGSFVPWYGALTRILLGHASLWLADVVRARTLLAEASRISRKVPDAVIFSSWFDEAWEHIDTLAETSLVGPSALTIAELRVLRFLPSHRSFREIGAQLGVSANTVKTQAHAVYRKLGAASRSEAVTRARQAGLLGN